MIYKTKTKLKHKRGFSLVELMVVVAIIGALTSIAIPSYDAYRKSAKKTAFKTDLTSLHKAWLIFSMELENFCKRKTGPFFESSIGAVGMESLFTSGIYGDRADEVSNFIGFSGFDSTSCGLLTVDSATGNNVTYGTGVRTTALHHNSPTASDLEKASAISISASVPSSSPPPQCRLDKGEYRMGVYVHIGKEEYFGFSFFDSGVSKEYDGSTDVDMADSTNGVCT